VKQGKHVFTEGSDGSSSELWFYEDESSKETHTSPPHKNSNGTTTTDKTETEKDKDGKTTDQKNSSTTKDDKQNTTTVTHTTDGSGKTKTSTESTDSNGDPNNPPEPPPGDNSGRDNPEGQGSEGPPSARVKWEKVVLAILLMRSGRRVPGKTTRANGRANSPRTTATYWPPSCWCSIQSPTQVMEMQPTNKPVWKISAEN
jgi:hypothetical protein